MGKISYLYKLILGTLIILLTGLTLLYSITQQDINTLIDFAESILEIAEKKGIDTTDISIEEYYVIVIEEAFSELDKLFNEKGWTFEEIEKILYPTGLIMSFINELKEDYVIEILEEEGITQKDIDVVVKNADRLSRYFISLDLDDWIEGTTDLDDLDLDDLDLDDIDDTEDFEYPISPDDESPEDAPPPH